MLCSKFGWNFPVVLEKKTLNSFQWRIFTMLQLSPLWEGCRPSFEQTWIPFTQECIYAKFGWSWTCDSGEDFLKFYFFIIPNYSPIGRACPFIWTNLNSFHQGILCAKFGWNWPSGCGEEDFEKLSIYLYNSNYLPFETGVALQLNKLESSSPRDTLWQFWLKLAQWFWRRRRHSM